MSLIAISGGIGSGKSVVSRILTSMGYPVYDCDSRAKVLMDTSEDVIMEIAARISSEVISQDHMIDRKALADIVFADSQALATLNSIVHSKVREDLAQWAEQRATSLMFVETAILYQSRIDEMVDAVWDVTAPIEVRIQRVMARNNLDRASVEARIRSQQYVSRRYHPVVEVIENSPEVAVLPQIEHLLENSK